MTDRSTRRISATRVFPELQRPGLRIVRDGMSATGLSVLTAGLAMVLVAVGAGGLLAQDAPSPMEAAEMGRPGPEHERLQALAGEWEVRTDGRVTGHATGRLRLGDRFLELEIHSQSGPVRHAIYTFGFDRRHGEYTVSAMDETGTYAVHARGTADGDRAVLYGTDDDPVMTSMGLEKAFAVVLHTPSPETTVVETRLIDTRTEARTEMPYFAFQLARPELDQRAAAEAAIRGVRAQSNAALAVGDVQAFQASLDDEYGIVSGAGAVLPSRDALVEALAGSLEARPDTRYVRRTDEVHLSSDGRRASEAGTWVGTWTEEGSPVRAGGDYLAHWVLEPAGWRLRGEIFVTLHCAGPGCDP